MYFYFTESIFLQGLEMFIDSS